MGKNSNWMSKLPEHLHDISLTEIAIPGSHDSFTYDIKKDNEIYKQSLPSFLGWFVKFPPTRYLVFNWSITQELTAIGQLENGIRYFDIRVAGKMEGGKRYIFSVHGMYSRKVMLYLEEIKKFLTSNNKEVVFLDFNHFYDMSSDEHYDLIDSILKLFGSMVCSKREMADLSLKWMWENGHQVIIIYHTNPVPGNLWPPSCLSSRWPEKSWPDDVVKVLNEEWEKNRQCPAKFKVYQGVLTPDYAFIIKRVTKNFKEALISLRAFRTFVQWVKSRKPRREIKCKKSKNQMNIVITDFVELGGFSDAVIRLNYE